MCITNNNDIINSTHKRFDAGIYIERIDIKFTSFAFLRKAKDKQILTDFPSKPYYWMLFFIMHSHNLDRHEFFIFWFGLHPVHF